MTMGALAIFALDRGPEPPTECRLVLCGVLLALALQIKLTAAIFIPATVIEIVLRSPARTWQAKRSWAIRGVFLITVTAIVCFVLVSLMFGGSYDQMWASLFSEELADHFAGSSEAAFSTKIFLKHLDGLVVGGVGLLTLLSRASRRDAVLPTVLFATALCVHSFRRPYWEYYYLHFAVPLALLGGIGMAHLCDAAAASMNLGAKKVVRRLSVMSCLLLLNAIILNGTSGRILDLLERASSWRLPEDCGIVGAMRRYAEGTRWVYTRGSIHAFHAGLDHIPELAVLPGNRIWSGRISVEDIWTIVRRYEPEQILISELPRNSYGDFVLTSYALVASDPFLRLYVKRTAMPSAQPGNSPVSINDANEPEGTRQLQESVP